MEITIKSETCGVLEWLHTYCLLDILRLIQNNMKEIYDKIRIGKVEYYQSEWNSLSKDSLDFTNKLIQK